MEIRTNAANTSYINIFLNESTTTKRIRYENTSQKHQTCQCLSVTVVDV